MTDISREVDDETMRALIAECAAHPCVSEFGREMNDYRELMREVAISRGPWCGFVAPEVLDAQVRVS